MEMQHVCMDVMTGGTKNPEDITHIIMEHDILRQKCCDENLNWLMEEIVFDFLCLEDDIIEDLCKDFPAQNNYQRYKVARSVGFDRKKLTNLNATQKGKPTNVSNDVGDSDANQRVGRKMDSRTLSSDQFDPNRELSVTKERNERISGGSPDPVEYAEVKERDPIVLNYELVSADVIGNEEENKRNSDCMKIRIQLVKTDTFGDSVGVLNGQDFVSSPESQSKTTKMKLRIPKSFIEADEKEGLRDFVISHVKEKYNNSPEMQLSEKLMST